MEHLLREDKEHGRRNEKLIDEILVHLNFANKKRERVKGFEVGVGVNSGFTGFELYGLGFLTK